MITWISANLPTLLSGAAVLGLVILSLRNILPRKGKPGGCAGCAGCGGNCGGNCGGCARCK